MFDATALNDLAHFVEAVIDRFYDKWNPARGQHTRVFRRLANRYGVEFLGCGIHRVVFRHGDLVYKVPHNSKGIDANLRELKVWETADHGVRGYLAASHEVVAGVLVAEYAGSSVHSMMSDSSNEEWARINTIAENVRTDISSILENLLRTLWKGGAHVDLHAGNISVEGLVLDYAGC